MPLPTSSSESSNATEPRRAAAATVAVASALLSLCGCSASEGPEYDPCLLLRTDRFEPQADGRGTVRVRKDGAVAMTAEAFISPRAHGVFVNACITRVRTERWALLTNWYLSDAVDYPIELVEISEFSRNDVPAFVGSLEICERAGCDPDEVVSVFDSFRGFLPSYEGSGQVTRYDPAEGHFAGWAKFENHERVQIEIDVDVTWEPPLDAGAPVAGDAETPRRGRGAR
jgi:hypothetical protein